MSRPLIGITDINDTDQIKRLLNVLDLFPSTKALAALLHIGVMISFKSLKCGVTTTKYRSVWLEPETISTLFSSILDDRLYRCIHYADYDGRTTANILSQVIQIGGTVLDAVQLDMPWPDPEMIKRAISDSGSEGIEIILQIGKTAQEEELSDPKRICDRLAAYQGSIHRVLIDSSMGQGLPMDAHRILPLLRRIHDVHPDLGLIVAGGLSATTLHLADPICEEFPGISIDAQGKLRPSGSSQEPLDIEMAAAYLTAALCHQRWSL